MANIDERRFILNDIMENNKDLITNAEDAQGRVPRLLSWCHQFKTSLADKTLHYENFVKFDIYADSVITWIESSDEDIKTCLSEILRYCRILDDIIPKFDAAAQDLWLYLGKQIMELQSKLTKILDNFRSENERYLELKREVEAIFQ